jgi:HPt (histidine-containing phosphotransfer) domain-containing protein
MDTQMPGVSGLRLIKALRQRLKSAAHNASRIVAISGSEVSNSILQAADGFLLKPIQVESLLALLEPERALSAAPAPSIEASADPNASGTQEPETVLDPTVLGKLKAMMPPAALKEVYSAVAADLEARLPSLAAAIDAGQATEVARIAHIIKGGCSMVGLSSATQAAARLEGSNRPDTWPQELAQLHFALGKLQDILEDGLL